MSSSERTPLLQSRNQHRSNADSDDPHDQFCALVGVPSSELPAGTEGPNPRPTSLYERATRERRNQNLTYIVTASVSNTLLLTQVVLGATVTALGASESSHVLITIFGVINTVIAGVVAYLKSRGQPMRARMYRDDMNRVVDEIENSEVMWLGIGKGMFGYEELGTDANDKNEVTVRSEVARLTRLYDRAVKTNTMNNPDIYMPSGGVVDGGPTGQTGSGTRPMTRPVEEDASPTVDPPVPKPDQSPVTKPKPKPAPAPAPASASAPGSKPTEVTDSKAPKNHDTKDSSAPKDDDDQEDNKDKDEDKDNKTHRTAAPDNNHDDHDDKAGPHKPKESPSPNNDTSKADDHHDDHHDHQKETDLNTDDTTNKHTTTPPSQPPPAEAGLDDILDDPNNPTIHGGSSTTQK